MALYVFPLVCPNREHVGAYTNTDGARIDLYLFRDGRSWGWLKTYTGPDGRPGYGTVSRGPLDRGTRADYLDAARRELISHALDQSRIEWGPAAEA